MIRIVLRFVILLVLLIVMPFLAFAGALRGTEIYFEKKLIPLPFESFGVAVAVASFCWMLALGFFILGMMSKKRGKS